jgi:hypothetical protein
MTGSISTLRAIALTLPKLFLEVTWDLLAKRFGAKQEGLTTPF